MAFVSLFLFGPVFFLLIPILLALLAGVMAVQAALSLLRSPWFGLILPALTLAGGAALFCSGDAGLSAVMIVFALPLEFAVFGICRLVRSCSVKNDRKNTSA